MVSVSKAIFHALAKNKGMQTFASRYGMRSDQSFARRFVGGETVPEAIAVARKIEASGMTETLHYLGESVASMAEADAATRSYIGVLNEIAASGVNRNVSLALTQLGLTVDRATCVDNLRRILDPAAAGEFFVRIDMEDSRYTQVTLDIFETLWQQGYRNAGVVLQACLSRSVEDARRMNRLGARVRLVKGAYKEPRAIAYQPRAQVDAAFVEIMQLLMTEGVYPAIAPHDVAMIDATKRFAASREIARDRFEFQMLYGIRRDLQLALTSEGYRVRVYVPFGREWFPYFMRRLGERPANVGYVLRTLMNDGT
jgi:proline dehydrogenase